MRLTSQIGNKEQSQIDVLRNPLTGAFRILADGCAVAEHPADSLSAGFSFARVRRYKFAVGSAEKHQVIVEHEFPAFLAGLRRQTYRVFSDGRLVAKKHGY
jgi:hypothetical protein